MMVNIFYMLIFHYFHVLCSKISVHAFVHFLIKLFLFLHLRFEIYFMCQRYHFFLMQFINIFFQLVESFLIFLSGSFKEQCLYFYEVQFINFWSHGLDYFLVLSLTCHLALRLKHFPLFFSYSFTLCNVTHFEFIFVSGMIVRLSFLFCFLSLLSFLLQICNSRTIS